MKSLLLQHLFTRFWAIAGAVSVRTKIFGIVLGLVLLLGLGITVQVRATLIRTMDAQLEEQAISVTRDLAARATDLILVNDLFATHQLLRETQANNANVRYAFVIDGYGQAAAHTFLKQPLAGHPAATRLHAQGPVLENAAQVPHRVKTEIGPMPRQLVGRHAALFHKEAGMGA